MERSDKETEVTLLDGMFQKSAITFCADYRGLTVEEVTKFRVAMGEVGGASRVVKNTLGRISAKNSLGEAGEEKVGQFVDLLSGPSMIIFGNEDPIGPAKVVTKFAKEHEKFEIKGGWFEGDFINKDEVVALSKLPSREEVLGQLLSVISAPATQLVRLLQAPAQQTVQVLEGHRKNLEEQG